MFKYTIIAGTKYKADSTALTLTEVSKAKQTARASLAHAFGGYTETKTKGGWINAKGELVTEPGVKFEALVDALNDQMAHDIAAVLRRDLGQESVVLSSESVTFSFIEA